ncbi:hypothetical protein EJ04DRAFT_525774 [Polyplosphaeria fusca]|uniref:RING-type domain-containing protein n=1 Tax=Polyplosphaeria fusca TaxID=682080 RepID=A0A9P4QUL0_9PLEO|nr:hypothetical protein EJ04DRAFT_525774 [Polyplosphaeria fusca]
MLRARYIKSSRHDETKIRSSPQVPTVPIGTQTNIMSRRVANLNAASQPWERLYYFGDRLRARGQTIPGSIKNIVSLDQPGLEDEHRELFQLVQSANAQTAAANENIGNAAAMIPSNFPAACHRIMDVLKFHFRANIIRSREDLIGNRALVYHECRVSGLVPEMIEALKEWEDNIGELREHLEDLTPEHDEVERDLQARLACGQAWFDPYTQQLDYEVTETIGPKVPISGFSRPVDPSQAPGLTCPICLDDLCNHQQVVQLSCAHMCGADCLSVWTCSNADQANTCPFCRAKLFVQRPRAATTWFQRYSRVHTDFKRLEAELALITQDIETVAHLMYEVAPNDIVLDTPGR